MKKKLAEYRKRIDGIDERILSLLEERMRVVRDVGSIKSTEGVGAYDPVREQEILDRLASKTALDHCFVRSLYRSIIGYCRGGEKVTPKNKKQQAKPLEGSCAILGPEGTFTEIAARKLFRGIDLAYKSDVEGVFKAVESGETGYGVVALENSLEGSVGKTMECLMEYDIHIVGEITLDINLALAGAQEPDTILSHPHALAQCRRYLEENHPKAGLVSSSSTAKALADAAEGGDTAAIGLAESARALGLPVVAENIQDDVSQTRFVALSREPASGGKTSIIFALSDEAGALYNILKVFADRGINLTKIESRPSRRKLGEYMFFMDFESKGANVGEILEQIKPKTTFLKVLGSY